MFYIDDWYPQEVYETPWWSTDKDRYRSIPSVLVSEMCCLSLNIHPLIGASYLEMEEEEESFRACYLWTNKDSHDYEGFFETSRLEWELREVNLYESIACQLELDGLPLTKDLIDNPFDSDDYIQKFKSAFYNRAVQEGWVTLGKKPHITAAISFLARYIHKEAFGACYRKRIKFMEEHRTENGGSLIYLNGTDGERIKFTDFTEWANSVGLELPEEFPRQKAAEPVSLCYGDELSLESDGITYIDGEYLDSRSKQNSQERGVKTPVPLSGHPETTIKWIIHIWKVEEKLKPGDLFPRGLQAKVIERAGEFRGGPGESTIKRLWKEAAARFNSDTE